MKLLFENLPNYDLQKIIINSLEQALYQVIVVIDEQEHVVWENEKKTLLSRNLMELRERLEHLNVSEMLLRQESAYDEMVGFSPSNSSNRMEVPLGKNPYAAPKWLQ